MIFAPYNHTHTHNNNKKEEEEEEKEYTFRKQFYLNTIKEVELSVLQAVTQIIHSSSRLTLDFALSLITPLRSSSPS